MPTALTTWVARRLTVLITSGQNNEAPPAPRASPTAATTDHGDERLEQDATAGHAAADDEGVSGRETAEQRAAGAAGGGGHQLADHVGAGSEQHPGGQVVAQKEDAPGVDAALGDLGQGEDDQEHEEAVPLQPADGVGGAGVLGRRGRRGPVARPLR